MITQTIKHWMSQLFAWWPWGKLPAASSVQIAGDLNKNAAQEAVWRSTAEGPGPQPGITSVVIEQGRSETSFEAGRSTIEEHAEQAAPSSPPLKESAPAAPPSAKEALQGQAPSPDVSSSLALTFEQRLIFLRHLIKQGIVNEGFAEGKVPDQYKKP